jgi:Methyltransferase domain
LNLFDVPPPPWDEAYWPRHVELVSFLLDSEEVVGLFERGARLPGGYGVGFDERVIEYPWLASRLPRGKVLDAGSTLNHPHVLERLLPRVDELHVVTLVPEAVSLPNVSYEYADLRDLPYGDGTFDAVVSLSTLEHIGMNQSFYGIHAPRADDPAAELRRAVAELRRVGQRLFATVPYGAAENHGWFRQLGRGEVESLGGEVEVFRYAADGWQRSSLSEAAEVCYHDHHADRAVPPDRAAAARAVACITF